MNSGKQLQAKKQREYSTKEIADAIGIHVNTVRFYEEMGFLTKPKRQSNGYRIFTDLQLEQCRLIRCAMRAEIIQNGLRKKAVEIVRLCADLDFEGSLFAADEYSLMIENEIESAKAAIASVENMLKNNINVDDEVLKRKEAADKLGLTCETLRTWERSGLIEINRSSNGYRVYSAADMERLNIVRTLRCANYSLSSILRLLNSLDCDMGVSVEKILNTPQDNEDIVSVCDRLIVSLQNTAADAKEIITMLKEIEKNLPSSNTPTLRNLL